MRRTIIAYLSDTHGGHRDGLVNPNMELEDEDGIPYSPDLNKYQQEIWNQYEKNRLDVFHLAGKDEIVLLHGGDVTQGDRFQDANQFHSPGLQFEVAAWNFKPWMQHKNIKKIRMVAGTKTHGWGRGDAARAVARKLRANKQWWWGKGNKDVKVFNHGLSKVGGVLVDHAHHGPGVGTRVWTRGSSLRSYLTSRMLDEITRGKPVPKLYLRAHVHELATEQRTMFADSKMIQSEIWISPSYCWMGDYARKVTQSKQYITIGMIAFEIIDGEITRRIPFFQEYDLRTG